MLGQVLNSSGTPLEIDGLWALAPGNDGNAGSSSLLYFTSGPDDEAHGLFGVLQAVPEPSTYLMLFGGLALIGGVVRRSVCARPRPKAATSGQTQEAGALATSSRTKFDDFSV